MNIDQKFAEIGRNVVYVKEIQACALPEALQEEAGDQQTIFAVHNADGEPLALVGDRKLAFYLARANALLPATVH